jgi:hypothetical protein
LKRVEDFQFAAAMFFAFTRSEFAGDGIRVSEVVNALPASFENNRDKRRGRSIFSRNKRRQSGRRIFFWRRASMSEKRCSF